MPRAKSFFFCASSLLLLLFLFKYYYENLQFIKYQAVSALVKVDGKVRPKIFALMKIRVLTGEKLETRNIAIVAYLLK